VLNENSNHLLTAIILSVIIIVMVQGWTSHTKHMIHNSPSNLIEAQLSNYQLINFCHEYSNCCVESPFVKISAICSCVWTCIMCAILWWIASWKKWYFTAIWWDLGVMQGVEANVRAPLLSSKVVECIQLHANHNCSLVSTSKVIYLKGSKSLIDYNNAMYSASIVETTISVCPK